MTPNQKRAAEQRAIGQRLRRRRLEAGLTAKTAAKHANVSLNTWQVWEVGTRPYPVDRLPAIAAALQVPLASLLTDDLVLQEIRMSEETLEYIRRGGKPAAEEVMDRYKPQLFALLMAAASAPVIDLSPGARAKPRRSREELLAVRAAGIAKAEAYAAASAEERRRARRVAAV